MSLASIETVQVPGWARPAKADRFALFEFIALMGLEGQWIRMAANDQRSLIGHPAFGRQAFRVHDNGTVDVIRSTAFGSDSEIGTYGWNEIVAAAGDGLRLSPGRFGPGIYSKHQEIAS